MKHLLPFVLTLAPLAGFAQTLTNDGAAITVQSGATLFVDGGVLNKAGSTLTNSGTVQTTGDLTNAGTLTSAGTLLFSGSTNQKLTPGTGATVATLVLNNTGATNQNVLTVAGDLTVGTAFTLTQGLATTKDGSTLNTITLPDGATLTETATSYVLGRVSAVRNAVSGSSAVVFPNSASLNPNGLALGTVTVLRTASLQTAGVSFGQNLAATKQGIDRVWNVAATGTAPTTATPATLALTWPSTDDNGTAAASPLQMWRAASAAGPWGKQGAPGNATITATSRTFSAAISELGTFTISNVTAPLPVELTRFAAQAQADDALLTWATASEKNNDHFDVEASADGKTFRRIATVDGHGSTTQPQQYQLVDKGIARYAADPVYYRLRQVDTDGNGSYSPVRTVRVAAPLALTAAAWPQPFGASGPTIGLRTALAGPATLRVYDALGRPVLTQALTLPVGSTALPLVELGPLASGVYVLRVNQGTQQATLKLVRE